MYYEGVWLTTLPCELTIN
uniref:Uncharacterized protein n=1 Tax=Arundo donax TaxID=35708 RepID=A0A0A9AV64_ARUDO